MCYILVQVATIVNKLAKGCLSNKRATLLQANARKKNKVLSLHNSVVGISHAKCKFDCARYTARTLDIHFRQTAFAYITTSTRFLLLPIRSNFCITQIYYSKKYPLK